MGLHSFDIFVLIVLVVTTVFGATKGLAWQLAQFASFTVSWYVASTMNRELAPMLPGEDPWNRLLAMLVLFVGTAILIWVGFWLISKTINRIQLKEFDRQMGALLGLVNGVLICCCITFFAVMLSEKSRHAVLTSHSGYKQAELIQKSVGLLPTELQTSLKSYFDRFNEDVNTATQDMDGPPSLLNNQPTDPMPVEPLPEPSQRAPLPIHNEPSDTTPNQPSESLGSELERTIWDRINQRLQSDH